MSASTQKAGTAVGSDTTHNVWALEMMNAAMAEQGGAVVNTLSLLCNTTHTTSGLQHAVL